MDVKARIMDLKLLIHPNLLLLFYDITRIDQIPRVQPEAILKGEKDYREIQKMLFASKFKEEGLAFDLELENMILFVSHSDSQLRAASDAIMIKGKNTKKAI